MPDCDISASPSSTFEDEELDDFKDLDNSSDDESFGKKSKRQKLTKKTNLKFPKLTKKGDVNFADYEEETFQSSNHPELAQVEKIIAQDSKFYIKCLSPRLVASVL